MRTNIDINDMELAKAMRNSGLKTKRETVDLALRQFNQMAAQREILKLRGKINWIGDLDEMRRD